MPTNNPNVKNAPPQKTATSAENKTKSTKANTKTAPADNLKAQLATIKHEMLGWVRQFAKFRDVENNNYLLGQQHMALGNLNDAIFRFRFVTWLNPQRFDAFYFLGCSRMANNDRTGAREALEKALAIKPDYPEAAYILAVVAGSDLPAKRLPKKMPLTLAAEFFDVQAAGYNHMEIDNRDYRGHILATNAARAQFATGRIDHVVLDLGAGTGLVGPLLRDKSSSIIGVDLSQPMLAEAMKLRDTKDNKIYDELINQDITAYLADAKDASFDLVMAANLFSFMGDISMVFTQVARVLKSGGDFVFTADKAEKKDLGDGYYFDGSVARFRFTAEYLEKLSAAAGLKTIKLEEAQLYPDQLTWLCVFKK